MFSKFELTNKGVELLNRVIAEQKTLKFTKFQIGKGDFSGDKKTLTQLVSKIDEFNVSQTNVLADGITNIKGFYDNINLSVASKLTEIGIMAQLGDDSLTEVLFSYSNQPSAEAETIPAKESYFSRTFSVMNRTDNVTSVTFDLTIRQDKYNFGTLAEMKAADYLDVGDKVTLWGNAALGDSSFKMYIITDQAQPIQLNNKLYAKEYFKIVNDLTTGGADNALSGEMGKKLNEDKFGNRNSLNIFDGTYQDFKIKNNAGSYIIQPNTFNLLAIPSDFYNYGILNVYYSGTSVLLVYIANSDRKEILYSEIFDFTGNTTFKNSQWLQMPTQLSIMFLGKFGASYYINIQDNLQKNIDDVVFDKVTSSPYYVKKTTNSQIVNEDFENISNKSLYKKIVNSAYLNIYENQVNKKTSDAYYSDLKLNISTGTKGIFSINVSAYLDTAEQNKIKIYKNSNLVSQSLGFKGYLSCGCVFVAKESDIIIVEFYKNNILTDASSITERSISFFKVGEV